MPNTSGHRALRRGRISTEGQIYLLTSATENRRRWFADWQVAHCCARIIHNRATWGSSELLCWVLMPDHWHGLLQLGIQESLAVSMNRFKSLLVKGIRSEFGIDDCIWQRGYHDHALRRQEDVRQVARYLIANPLRAGLVTNLGDYPFWNAVWLDGAMRDDCHGAD